VETGLVGRSALVSGGSKGIGKGIARALALEGVSVALLARTEHEVLAAAQEIAGETGVTVVRVQADVTDTDSLKAAVEHLSGLASFNPLNIVVNNAAPPITRTDRQIEWTDKEWFAAIDVKTVGALRLIRETIHLIPHDGTGRIINVPGGSGIAVLSPALLHGINNAALLHMTGFLAADLAANKVTVNAIVPGLVGTEFRQIWAKELGERQGKSTEEFVGEFCKSKGILLERWAEVSEIGDLVVFLASDRASYITGAKIPIDGGFSINSR
jgi:NAD(P)-dependent dehydrogenase (short-subunit alcohol dehydrogenase family)